MVFGELWQVNVARLTVQVIGYRENQSQTRLGLTLNTNAIDFASVPLMVITCDCWPNNFCHAKIVYFPMEGLAD